MLVFISTCTLHEICDNCDNWPHHFLVPHASLVVLMCSDVISCRLDGMELPMEKISEYEAHVIKVGVWVCVLPLYVCTQCLE